MLILTRNAGEEIAINDDIKVVVLGVRGGQVRIGIDAPFDVKVYRKEIYDKIQANEKGPKNGPKNNNERTNNGNK